MWPALVGDDGRRSSGFPGCLLLTAGLTWAAADVSMWAFLHQTQSCAPKLGTSQSGAHQSCVGVSFAVIPALTLPAMPCHCRLIRQFCTIRCRAVCDIRPCFWEVSPLHLHVCVHLPKGSYALEAGLTKKQGWSGTLFMPNLSILGNPTVADLLARISTNREFFPRISWGEKEVEPHLHKTNPESLPHHGKFFSKTGENRLCCHCVVLGVRPAARMLSAHLQGSLDRQKCAAGEARKGVWTT